MAKEKKTSSKKSKVSKKADKEEVTETFEIENKKTGKTEVKTVHGSVEEKHAGKKEIEHQNNILKWILIIAGAFLIVLILWGIISYNIINFSYRGVDFQLVDELAPYKASFPVIIDGKNVIYNIYLRNDPRILGKEVPFNGNMHFGNKFSDGMYRLVVNSTEELDCDGDEIISVVNMGNLKANGIKVVKDPNAACDPEGRYMFANIVLGNKTEINTVGYSCYDIVINDCEVLKGTERFMTEVFVKYSEFAR